MINVNDAAKLMANAIKEREASRKLRADIEKAIEAAAKSERTYVDVKVKLDQIDEALGFLRGNMYKTQTTIDAERGAATIEISGWGELL